MKQSTVRSGNMLVLTALLWSAGFCNRGMPPEPQGGDAGHGRPLARKAPFVPPSRTGRHFYAAPDGSPQGGGNPGQPWDLATALSRLEAGDTVFLRGGTYLTGADFGTSADSWYCSRSGTAAAPIAIYASPGETPVIKGHFRITGNYLHLAGLTFEGGLSRDPTSKNERREVQVWLKDCHDVVFEANEVRNNDYHAGVFLSGVHHIQVLRCYIHDNGRFGLRADPLTGSLTYNVDHGLYWGSSSGGGNLIANCLFENNHGYGVHLYPKAYDIDVLHNTMVTNGNSGLIVAGGSDRITVANNIAAFNERNRQMRISSGASNVVSHNLTWSPRGNLGGIENRAVGHVEGNQVGDPMFVDRAAGDYRLQSRSPAVDGGGEGRGVPSDYEGASRPRGGGYDCGAFEGPP